MQRHDNPDTTLGTEFWRTHPHLFIPAHWGPEYCRCCLDPGSADRHQVQVDSAMHVDNCTGYRVTVPARTMFAVVGWSDRDAGGGSCSYAAEDSYEDALAFVEEVRANGDHHGRRYERYEIHERRYYTAVDTNVVVLDSHSSGVTPDE